MFWVFVFVFVVAVAECSSSNHTNNWAVLVDTSRFWFNYRHAANVFSLYRTLKRLGFADSRIILMVADPMACEAQNPFPGQVFNDEGRSTNIFGTRVEIDYRGNEVTAEALMRVLTGRHGPEVPNSKRLLTDANSNVLIYLTGHGGDEFFKFQDAGEISSFDLADAFHGMSQKQRFNEMLVIADTCQANTLYERLHSPNVVMVGSSARGESSWSKGSNAALGTTMVDRFTDSMLRFFEQHGRSDPSLLKLVRSFDTSALNSRPGWVSKLSRPLDKVPVSDFFAAKESRLKMSPSPVGPSPSAKSCGAPRLRVHVWPREEEKRSKVVPSPKGIKWAWVAIGVLSTAALLLV